jgi:hypothetical protein
MRLQAEHVHTVAPRLLASEFAESEDDDSSSSSASSKAKSKGGKRATPNAGTAPANVSVMLCAETALCVAICERLGLLLVAELSLFASIAPNPMLILGIE